MFSILGQLNLGSHREIFQHFPLETVIPTFKTNPSDKRTMIIKFLPTILNPSQTK